MRDINRSSVKIVGVLNVTPDSFSDGGRSHISPHLLTGADIIDIGGESTRPGSHPVDLETELSRVLPVCESLSGKHVISIDTYKAAVADRCLAAGATIINDVSALRADAEMIAVVREHGCEIVLMHNNSAGPLPHAAQNNERRYTDVVKEVAEFLLERVDFALAKGVKPEKIILDPGCGAFISSDASYSWQLLRELERFVELVKPFPVYLGVSRKGFLGGPLEQRDPVSQLVALDAVKKGASYIRTHAPGMLRTFLDAATRL